MGVGGDAVAAADGGAGAGAGAGADAGADGRSAGRRKDYTARTRTDCTATRPSYGREQAISNWPGRKLSIRDSGLVRKTIDVTWCGR